MDLPRFMSTIKLNNEPPRAPRVLLYIAGGRAVHCLDVDTAKGAAENLAAERPGITVGVYQLVGFAHRPVEKPVFQDSEQALSSLLVAEPDSGIINTRPDDHVEVDRDDLSPGQREQLDRMRASMRDDGEDLET